MAHSSSNMQQLCDHKNLISVPKPLNFLTGNILDSRRSGKSCWCHCSLSVDHVRFHTTIVWYLFRQGMNGHSKCSLRFTCQAVIPVWPFFSVHPRASHLAFLSPNALCSQMNVTLTYIRATWEEKSRMLKFPFPFKQ